MLIFIVLFFLLVGWGLKEGDIYWPEALIWAVIYALLIGAMLVERLLIPAIIGLLIATVVLVLRTVGSDLKAW